MADSLMGTTAFAAASGSTPQHVRRLARRGELRAEKVDGHWRVYRSELERFHPRRRPSRWRENQPDVVPGAARGVVVLLAQEVDRPWRVGELSVLLDRHPGNVRRALLSAESRGLVDRVGDAGWVVTEAGRDFAATPELSALADMDGLRVSLARFGGLLELTPAGRQLLAEGRALAEERAVPA